MTPKQIRETILWLRREKIGYSSLVANGFELHGVVDMKQIDEAKATPEEPKPTMYQKFGGALLTQPTAKKNETTPDEAVID